MHFVLRDEKGMHDFVGILGIVGQTEGVFKGGGGEVGSEESSS